MQPGIARLGSHRRGPRQRLLPQRLRKCQPGRFRARSAEFRGCPLARSIFRPAPLRSLMRRGGAGLRDGVGYNAAISACGRGRQWQQALSLLGHFGEARVEADVVSYGAAISACEKCGRWQQALLLLGELWRAALDRSTICHSAAVSACARSGEWQQALLLLGGAWRGGLQLDVVSYNAAVSACARGGRWQQAQQLLGELRREGLEPDVVSYNAAISACEKGGQWQEGLSLLRELPRTTLEPISGIQGQVLQAGKSFQGLHNAHADAAKTTENVAHPCAVQEQAFLQATQDRASAEKEMKKEVMGVIETMKQEPAAEAQARRRVARAPARRLAFARPPASGGAALPVGRGISAAAMGRYGGDVLDSAGMAEKRGLFQFMRGRALNQSQLRSRGIFVDLRPLSEATKYRVLVMCAATAQAARDLELCSGVLARRVRLEQVLAFVSQPLAATDSWIMGEAGLRVCMPHRRKREQRCAVLRHLEKMTLRLVTAGTVGVLKKDRGPWSRAYLCTYKKSDTAKHHFILCSEKCEAKFEKECLRCAEANLEVKVFRKIQQRAKARNYFCPKCFYELKEVDVPETHEPAVDSVTCAYEEEPANANAPKAPITEMITGMEDLGEDQFVVHKKGEEEEVDMRPSKKASKANKKKAMQMQNQDEKSTNLARLLFRDPNDNRVVSEEGEIFDRDKHRLSDKLDDKAGAGSVGGAWSAGAPAAERLVAPPPAVPIGADVWPGRAAAEAAAAERLLMPAAAATSGRSTAVATSALAAAAAGSTAAPGAAAGRRLGAAQAAGRPAAFAAAPAAAQPQQPAEDAGAGAARAFMRRMDRPSPEDAQVAIPSSSSGGAGSTQLSPPAGEDIHVAPKEVGVDGLPPGWKAAWDPSSKDYYYYSTTGEVTWDRPRPEPTVAAEPAAYSSPAAPTPQAAAVHGAGLARSSVHGADRRP
ncbi:unnamed protein product [Prorocentrum cordatum]|uniref:WW domain-containing protein n=1 Tax=Prorocentrum cordatum TaxID=2364126 RepID=A0ABN9RBC4_9DINO|nr:unnamed protein product [Polarella glacialis]